MRYHLKPTIIYLFIYCAHGTYFVSKGENNCIKIRAKYIKNSCKPVSISVHTNFSANRTVLELIEPKSRSDAHRTYSCLLRVQFRVGPMGIGPTLVRSVK